MHRCGVVRDRWHRLFEVHADCDCGHAVPLSAHTPAERVGASLVREKVVRAHDLRVQHQPVLPAGRQRLRGQRHGQDRARDRGSVLHLRGHGRVATVKQGI